MKPAHVDEHYTAYLEGSLPESLRREVEAHLRECPRCVEELDALRRLVADLHRMPAEVPVVDLAAGVRARLAARRPARVYFLHWPALAGGLAVLALAVLCCFLHVVTPARAPSRLLTAARPLALTRSAGAPHVAEQAQVMAPTLAHTVARTRAGTPAKTGHTLFTLLPSTAALSRSAPVARRQPVREQHLPVRAPESRIHGWGEVGKFAGVPRAGSAPHAFVPSGQVGSVTLGVNASPLAPAGAPAEITASKQAVGNNLPAAANMSPPTAPAATAAPVAADTDTTLTARAPMATAQPPSPTVIASSRVTNGAVVASPASPYLKTRYGVYGAVEAVHGSAPAQAAGSRASQSAFHLSLLENPRSAGPAAPAAISQIFPFGTVELSEAPLPGAAGSAISLNESWNNNNDGRDALPAAGGAVPPAVPPVLSSLPAAAPDGRVLLRVNGTTAVQLTVYPLIPALSEQRVEISAAARTALCSVPSTPDGAVLKLIFQHDKTTETLYLLVPGTNPRPTETTLAAKAQPAYQPLKQLAQATGLYLLCPSALAERPIDCAQTRTAPLTALTTLLREQQYQLTRAGVFGNITAVK